MANSIYPGAPTLAPDGSAAAPSYSFASNQTAGLYNTGSVNLGCALAANSHPFITNDGSRAQRALFDGQFGIGWSSGSPIDGGGALSQSDTQLIRTAAGTLSLQGTTPMLQFGGTTSAFPALRQLSSNILQAVTADGSSPTYLQAYSFTTTSNLGWLQIGPARLIQVTAPVIASGFGTSPSIANSNASAVFVVNVGTGATASSGVITMPAASTGWIAMCNDVGNTAGLHTYQTANTTTSITLTCQNSAGAATAWAASTLVYVIAMGY
jgi:hypothetical protein